MFARSQKNLPRLISRIASNYGQQLKIRCDRKIVYVKNLQVWGWLKKPVGRLCIAWVPSMFVVKAWGWGSNEEKPKAQEIQNENSILSEEEKAIQQADELYVQHHTMQLYELLIKYKDCSNDEILWRLARAAVDKGKVIGGEEKKALYYEAFDYAKRSLELNDKNPSCHKWFAVLLDYTGEYEGTKQRISNAFQVKEHFMKAIELNPKDATSVHSIGYWCFLFADLAWYQRKIASVIFTSPPTSTYEEALEYLLKAETIEPNFYSMNLMMIGKTYQRMKNNQKAKEYLIRARDYPVRTSDDKKAHEESIELLKTLGVES
ncbi:unnamed protein product [Owenia fusiformis]|uniref:Regulator of microtubule dynamics protein 1 n=1 Tax=Owenia fusiformis TaxID=6347 RepID=A0A8J1Y8W0_OWEFU|nr:unnamed protein product [Owenia fusiformis]